MSQEDELADLGRALEQADQVQFGGRQWTVEELLGDGNISQLLTEYLTNPTSQQSLALKNDSQAKPLLDFAERYRTTLETAAKQMSAAVTESQRRVDANTALGKFGNANLSKEMMDFIYGAGWDKRGSEVQKPKAVLFSLQELAPGEQETFVTSMNDLTRRFPEAMQSMADLSANQIRSLMANGGVAWKSYESALDYKRRLDEMDTADEIAAMVGLDPGALSAQLRQTASQFRDGLISSRGIGDLLDADRDGILDDPLTVQAALRKTWKPLSLAEVLSPQRNLLTKKVTAPSTKQRLPTLGQPPAVSGDKQTLLATLQEKGINNPEQLLNAPVDTVSIDDLNKIVKWGGEYGRRAQEAVYRFWNKRNEEKRHAEWMAARAQYDQQKRINPGAVDLSITPEWYHDISKFTPAPAAAAPAASSTQEDPYGIPIFR